MKRFGMLFTFTIFVLASSACVSMTQGQSPTHAAVALATVTPSPSQIAQSTKVPSASPMPPSPAPTFTLVLSPSPTVAIVPPSATASAMPNATRVFATLSPTRISTRTKPPATVTKTLECFDQCGEETIIRIRFPFKPSFPGYLVEVRNAAYSADLICALERGGQGGQVLDLKADAKENGLGVCDSESMTLYRALEGDLTLRVILGGFPFIDNVTKQPARIITLSNDPKCQSKCRQIEYEFESQF